MPSAEIRSHVTLPSCGLSGVMNRFSSQDLVGSGGAGAVLFWGHAEAKEHCI